MTADVSLTTYDTGESGAGVCMGGGQGGKGTISGMESWDEMMAAFMVMGGGGDDDDDDYDDDGWWW